MALLTTVALAPAAEFIGGDSVEAVSPTGNLTYSMFELRKVVSYRNQDGVRSSGNRHVLKVVVDPGWVRMPVSLKHEGRFVAMPETPPTTINAVWFVDQMLPHSVFTVGMTYPLPSAVTLMTAGAAEMGDAGCYVHPAVPISASSSSAGLGLNLEGPGSKMEAHWPANGWLGEGNFRVTAKVVKRWAVLTAVEFHPEDYHVDPVTGFAVRGPCRLHHDQGGWLSGWGIPNEYSHYYLKWSVREQTFYRNHLNYVQKRLATDASVDTRRAYGQPDKAGVIAGDPNSGLNTINFGSWDFKGGLFLGNMPPGTNDRSGKARVQLYFTPATGAVHRASLFSFYPTEHVARSGYANSFTVGVHRVAANDPNLNTTEANVRWDTRWNIDPASPSGTATVIFPRTGVNDDYVSIPIPELTVERPGLVLALTNEPADPGDPGAPTGWFYIASREWQAKHMTTPAGYDTTNGFYIPLDSRARVWRLTGSFNVDWNEPVVGQ